MSTLRGRVAEIAQLIPRARPVVYLDYPVHTNIGDLLIERGTEVFFESSSYDVAMRRSAVDFGPHAARRVPTDATIVLHGGGNFGDLYDLHQPFREQVVARFPNHRIVLLPQTMHFASLERLKAAAAIFARHPDLHVCLRDEASLETYRRYFVNPAYLMPDMAHLLWGMADVKDAASGGKGTLLLQRRDREGQDFPVPLAQNLEPCDWLDFEGLRDTLVFRSLRKVHVKPGLLLGGRLSPAQAWRAYTRRLVNKAFRAIGAYDAIVTNRLHAAIFGLLLGKPVTMSDNSYGKLSTYYATWLTDIPNVRLIGAETEAHQPPELLRASAER